MSSQTPRYPAQTRSGTITSPSFTTTSPNYNSLPQQSNSQAHEDKFQTMDFVTQSPTTPPKTPRRVQQGSSNNARVNAVQGSATKQKSRGKNRARNVNPSPAVHASEDNTPPTLLQSTSKPATARPISTPSAAAYAGPTFHASPAPSALPMPSFYSKSVPESPGMQAMQKSRKENATSSGSESPTPPVAKFNESVPAREESPLDFIFNAHREESRARSASASGGPFEPPAGSPQNTNVTPVSSTLSSNRGHFSGGSVSSLFAMELDGNNSPGKPIGAAFSTPYSDRINAARSGSSQSPQQSNDRSQALKDFLFSQQSPQQSSSLNGFSFPDIQKQPAASQRTISTPLRAQYNSHHKQYEGGSNTLPRAGNRASGLRKEVPFVTPTKVSTDIPYQKHSTPSRVTHGNSTEPHFLENLSMNSTSVQEAPLASPFGTPRSDNSTDLRGMEDSLRRLLKLEPNQTTAAPGAGSGLGNLPDASASVPNYVGGRNPPLNGLHNGVMGS